MTMRAYCHHQSGLPVMWKMMTLRVSTVLQVRFWPTVVTLTPVVIRMMKQLLILVYPCRSVYVYYHLYYYNYSSIGKPLLLVEPGIGWYIEFLLCSLVSYEASSSTVHVHYTCFVQTSFEARQAIYSSFCLHVGLAYYLYECPND